MHARPAKIRTVAMLGNHLPRHCGIATFTTDLIEALAVELPGIDCFVLAMNDPGHRHAYPPRVRFEIAETDLSSYRRAADFLDACDVDVVSVQHEYGIFGGPAGSHLLALLAELRVPIVTTLHTILAKPDREQRQVMEALALVSERLVVMSDRAVELLAEVHGVDTAKIDRIPHGISPAPTAPRSKYHLGLEGKPVILTFGLLSPDKGIEFVIDALPAVVERFPSVRYLVVGATHPHVRERDGETYRLTLETRARRLGVDANVIFHDRFVSRGELTEFLAAADVYITPYLSAEQISSGTLAYAVGAGKAVISTPYVYARELLADRRGVLVPWRDSTAIAAAAIELLGDDATRAGFSSRAAAYGRAMEWPAVARQYVASFERARLAHGERRRTSLSARTLAAKPADLPSSNLDHLVSMTDSTGLLQHAVFTVPRYDDGYCLDDNARGLMLMTFLEDARTEDAATVRALTTRYFAFVRHAFHPAVGRFRNFMTYTRRWTEEVGSDDSHGRALWALGAVVGRSRQPARRSLATELFHAGLRAVGGLGSPRAWAFALLGIAEYLRAFDGDTAVQSERSALAERLLAAFRRAGTRDWPWFEDRLSYCNARLPHALLAAGSAMGNEEMTAAALRSLEWLGSVQRNDAGDFAPVGSNDVYVRGGPRPAFDQQPIDAWATISACREAQRVTGDERWRDRARTAFRWFLGQNHLQRPLYDAATGGCRDGLHADRVNENQGAESTLAFQLALFEMRLLEGPIPSAAREAR